MKMKQLVGLVLVAMLWGVMTTALQAQANFTLTGTQTKDVTTWYGYGWLYDSSSVTILTGGNVNEDLWAYNTSSVNISDGSVFTIRTRDNSSVNMSGGIVDYFQAYHNSTVDISDGRVREYLHVFNTSSVNMSGGYVKLLGACDSSSTVNMSDGTVDYFSVSDLLLNGPQRVTITGGTVGTLEPEIHLHGSEHLNYTGHLSDLASFGVQAAPGTVGSINGIIVAYDTSSVDMFGDTMNLIYAYDTSSVNIFGGTVGGFIAAHNTSSVNISGDSSVFILWARDTSCVSLSGGSVYHLEALESSSVILNGFDFELGTGLSWDSDGQTLLGTGLLSGKWFGQTERWTINIYENDATATIQVIPEPTTLSLLALGTLSFLRRRQH